MLPSGVPNDLAVNSAGDAVLELQVHLGDRVLGEDGGIGDITCKSILSDNSANQIRSFLDLFSQGRECGGSRGGGPYE